MSKQGGFTIIEVSLYLAISGLLAAVIVLGLGAMVRDQEWKSSTNDARNLIQTEYQKVANVINNSGGTSSGKSDHLLIGRYIQFTDESSDYTTGNIIAEQDVTASGVDPAFRADDVKALNSSQLTAQNSVKGRLTYAAKFLRGPSALSALAIVHSPISGAIYIFTVDDNKALDDGQKIPDLANPNQSLALVLQQSGGGIVGALCLASGSSASNIIYAAPFDVGAKNEDVKQRCGI